MTKVFFGLMFALWLGYVAMFAHAEPDNFRLMLACAKYTFLGLAHVAGLY
jgi:hypothetical protein